MKSPHVFILILITLSLVGCSPAFYTNQHKPKQDTRKLKAGKYYYKYGQKPLIRFSMERNIDAGHEFFPSVDFWKAGHALSRIFNTRQGLKQVARVTDKKYTFRYKGENLMGAKHPYNPQNDVLFSEMSIVNFALTNHHLYILFQYQGYKNAVKDTAYWLSAITYDNRYHLGLHSIVRKSISLKFFESKPDFHLAIGSPERVTEVSRRNTFKGLPFAPRQITFQKRKKDKEFLYFDYQSLKDTLLAQKFSNNYIIYNLGIHSPNSWELGCPEGSYSPQNSFYLHSVMGNFYFKDVSYLMEIVVKDTVQNKLEYINFYPMLAKAVTKSHIPNNEFRYEFYPIELTRGGYFSAKAWDLVPTR